MLEGFPKKNHGRVSIGNGTLAMTNEIARFEYIKMKLGYSYIKALFKTNS